MFDILSYFLYQAAKIDPTDVNLWYEIGYMSQNSKRFLVAKYAFKQALVINSKHWPSLNNLIILLYAIGDYTRKFLYIFNLFEKLGILSLVCLKYTMQAFNIDKFYVYGIIVFNSLLQLNNEFYTNDIKKFLKDNQV